MASTVVNMVGTSAPNPSVTNVCAVVVAYHPDAAFEARLRRILPQVVCLVVVDNTPEPITLSQEMRSIWERRLHCISNADNKGIAMALNQGLAYAAALGYPWLLTLDQDTTCYPDMVATLSETYADCPLALAILGSNYFDPSNQKCKVPLSSGKLWLEQKTVITSGCLVNVAVACALHGLREDYFIDQVDHEFCLRVRAHGYRVAITCKPTMIHRVGEAGGVWLPVLGHLPRHSPLRRYYIVRNSLWTIRAYALREPVWCFKRLLRVLAGCLLAPFTAEVRREVWAAQWRGWVAGWRERGPGPGTA